VYQSSGVIVPRGSNVNLADFTACMCLTSALAMSVEAKYMRRC
jgi:hypothetical protein